MGTVEQLRVINSGEANRAENQSGMVEHRRSSVSVVDKGAPSGVRIIPVAECFPPKEKEKKGLPILIAPGFTEGIETLELNLEHLAERGLHALTFDAPQGISREGEFPIELANLGEMALHEYETKKALALLEVVEQKKIEGKIDAIGHSEGCIYLVLAALARPEKFRTLLLVNPGGMVGQDTFFSLISRAYDHVKQERRVAQQDPVILKRLKKGKFERRLNLAASLVEGATSPRAVACTQIEELLVILKKKGVHIVIAHSVDDLIFPMDRVQEISAKMAKKQDTHSGKDEEVEEGTYLDGFYSIRGGHNDFFLNPEDHAILADHTFSAIEAKEARTSGDGLVSGDIIRKAA